MKQCITPAQQESLSRKGTLSWKAYCLEKNYGTAFPEDEHYIPILQPNIGQLMEYLKTKKIPFTITDETAEPVDYLWVLVQSDLES